MISGDVLVAGGGPAGAALALALRRRGVARVAVAPGPASSAPFRIGESASPDTPLLLARLGVSDDLATQGHLPCHGNLSLWGDRVPVQDDFFTRGRGCGWHLDRAAFDRGLLDAAAAAGATILPAGAVHTVASGPDGWRVGFSHGGTVTARVVADCTGRSTAVAARLGVRRRRIDRLAAAAVMLPAGDAPLRGLSLIEAAPDGWWYAARIPGDRVVLALTTDSDILAERGLHHGPVFHAAWAATTEIRRHVPLPGHSPAVAVFPAPGQFLPQACGPGWIAVGDALTAMDPLTAAGINGALDDALAAAETVAVWLGATSHADCIDAAAAYSQRANATLQRYLTERRQMYGREGRWPASPFWRRRHGAASPDA